MQTTRFIGQVAARNALLYNIHGRYTSLIRSSLRPSSTTNKSSDDKGYRSQGELSFDSTTFDRWPTPVLWAHFGSFLLCQSKFLVAQAPKMMQLGNHPRNPFRGIFRWIMRHTIYDQFVGGASDEEIQETCRILERYGIEPMLAVPIETETIKPGQDISEWHNDNTDKLVDCIEKGKKFAIKHKPVVHIKLTGIMDDEIFIKISEHIGRDLFSSVPDSEGRSSKQRFEDCVDDLVELIKNRDHPCPYLLTFLTPDELKHVKTGVFRLARIGEAIGRTGTETLVDAEYIALNPTITVLTMALARIYNTSTRPLVGNTYQCYLKNASNLVDYEIDYLRGHDCSWTAKMVRGAYMVSEASRAQASGYENPVCDGKEATHANYNGIVDALIDRLAKGEHVNFLLASHNEESIHMVVKRVEQLEKDGITVGDDIIFAQLYGMCGHISSGLSRNNVPVYKALPIGGISDVLPYLARRAQENKTVLMETHRERGLLWEAIQRRGYIKRREL